nr:sigma factor-like helix-turn-helix DNA-binding protein [Micromonospora purpureochromogenes]
MADTHRPARPRRETPPATLDLLRRAQDGDRDAFGRLYAEHLDLITRYVAARLRDRDRDAIPDVVHDAFADALTELAYAPKDVTGWFLQLAARACTRHGWTVRRYLRAAHEIHDQTAPAAEPAAAPRTFTAGRRTAFVVGMARLTDNQRTAIQLRYLDGYPRDLASAVMGRSTAAIRDLERRGLRRLNAALALSAAGVTAVAR